MIEGQAWHYDGRNANRWPVRIVGTGESFRLFGDGWESGPWNWADLLAVDHAGPGETFGHREEQGWRLGFAEDVPAELAAMLPKRQLYGGFIDRIGLWKASAVLACVAGLVLFVGLKAPGWVAPFVPQSWEDDFGDAMLGDFGGRTCRTPEGEAALRALATRMDPQREARSITIANIPMVNAVALPGRHVILFRGLIDQAKSPDEVAGVLGHELGHVAHRDTMAALLRQLGLSVILSGMGGSTGGNVNALLSLSYSREAEHEADLAAIEGLRRANISPLPTAGFFERLGGDGEGKDKSKNKNKGKAGAGDSNSVEEAAGWLASHPSSGSRRALFEQAAVKGHRYGQALTSDQWNALKAMCAKDRTVKPALDFGL